VRAGVLVEDDGRRLAADLAQRPRDDAGVGAVGGDDQPSRVAMPAGANPLELRVGLLEDPRQALGKLG
jgi:hypothetical protein